MYQTLFEYLLEVAPFAGAWIEIFMFNSPTQSIFVAPFAGAWIEIREVLERDADTFVAPFAGAWIEITDACITFD